MKAREVLDALRRRHGADGGTGEWVCVEEAFCGWASAGGGIDLLAIGAWRTAKAQGLPGAGRNNGRSHGGRRPEDDARYPVVAYEVKVSRADMRRELYGYAPKVARSYRTRAVLPWPGKAHQALAVSHFFMFAVPVDLLTERELEQDSPQEDRSLFVPPEAGLLEVSASGKCHVRITAPRRVPRALERGEVAELIRHAVDPNQLRKAREQVRALEGTIGSYERRLREAGL